MANVLGELFQNIADAIRSKTGSTDTLKPNQFPEAIEGITAGGGGSSADVRYVTFRNESTGEEYKKAVAVGDDCVDVVAKGLWKTPTKESTAQYNYTFYGWGASDGGAADANILKNITEDKTVYAIFTATVRYYTITFYDEDGTTVLATKQAAYGSVPSYTTTLTKDNYTATWSPSVVAVTGDESYTLVWVENGWQWDLTDGVLTISGAGPMDAFSASNRPWVDDKSSITRLVVEEGITYLSSNICYECDNLTSVSLPATLNKIGMSAFYGCTALESVRIPDGVATIEQNTFFYCSGLKECNIPSSLDIVPYGMFYKCTSLENVSFANGAWRIFSSSFMGCSALKNITIPYSVTSILSGAFKESGLTSAIFANTTGWFVATTDTATSGTNISSSNLANKSKAATFLVTTYVSKYWIRT